MYNIKLMNKISPSGLSILDPAKYSCSDSIENPDAMIVRSASLLEEQFPASLKAIARAGAGTNNVPAERCTEQGIVVFNTPGGNANAVKELTITGLLLAGRRIVPAIEWAATLKGQGDVGKLAEKGKGNYVGPELTGKTLGVVGLGAIGMKVANTAVALGMKVLGYDPFLSVDAACRLDPAVGYVKTLKEIYRNADFISLHLPVNAETKGLINRESLTQMKKPVRIVNFARGELVNNPDLLTALESGDVARYVTDFCAEELLGHPAIVSLPHLGASTPESEDNCALMAAEQLRDFLENGNIRNSVNLPGLALQREGAVRFGVIHRKDLPSASIVEAVAEAKVSASAGRGEIAYTIVDANTAGDSEQKLAAMDGVVRVLVFA